MSSFQRILRQRSFVVAFGVLLFAAVGLNAATQFMKLHFKKLPVPLARPLEGIPASIGADAKGLGGWICISNDQLGDEIQQELGTDKYVMRYYVNSAVVEEADITQFEKKSNKDAMALISKLRQKYRDKLDRAIISFAVTYYTGKADTVAHIPERCYTADGYEPTSTTTETWDLKDQQSPDGKLKVRYISFEDQAGAQSVKRNVAYFFHANGSYTSDPSEVRIRLQSLFRKYGYYAKIELMVQDPDREKAADAMRDFLVHALPEVEKCLPDYSKLKDK